MYVCHLVFIINGNALADQDGGPGVGSPFFWPINAFEWGHIVGSSPPFVLGWEPPF